MSNRMQQESGVIHADHPAWCSPDRHDEYDREHDERTGSVRHEVAIGSGWMPEARRVDGLEQVTRAGLGSWAVRLVRDDPRSGAVLDETIDVLVDGGITTAAKLLPGEARELAAALLRAADVALFGLPIDAPR